MKKIIFLILVLCISGCTNSIDKSQNGLYQGTQETHNQLKQLSPECRKAELVFRVYARIYQAEQNREYYKSAILRCMAIYYHDMSYVDINRLIEGSIDYYISTITAIAKGCTDVLVETKEKDSLSLFLNLETNEKIIPYLQEHLDECIDPKPNNELKENNIKE